MRNPTIEIRIAAAREYWESARKATQDDIARRYGVTVRTLHNWARRYKTEALDSTISIGDRVEILTGRWPLHRDCKGKVTDIFQDGEIAVLFEDGGDEVMVILWSNEVRKVNEND